MNKLLLTMALLVLVGINLMGQTKISGVVKDSSTGKEIYDLSVMMVETGQEVQTDRIGYFQFVDVPAGDYTIRVSGVGYQSLEQEVRVNGEPHIDLGDLSIQFNPVNETVGVITLTADELDDDESSSQSSVGLLQSSRDVFASSAAFDLGAFWFRVRGYDNKYNDVFFNGIRMNKIDNDRVSFNNWGGLNDVTRYPSESTYGLEPSNVAFGDIGGVTNYDTRPSMMRKGLSFSYSATNRSYRNRLMLTYNTGLMENGWGFTVSGSRRWAEEGIIEGTLYDAWAYYLGVEKKINDKHTLNLTSFGAPNRRASNSPNTQEIFDLMGTDYNAYWGWQDGEKRNERIKKTFEPITMLTHHWTMNNRTKLTTSVAYQFGSDSGTRLDWNDASNPSPIYYRYLPSFAVYQNASTDIVNAITNNWLNNQNVSQIDWTKLYQTNSLDPESKYVLASDHVDDKTLTFSTNLKSQFTNNIDFVIAASYQNTTSDIYRELDDLLGGQYYSNIDDFREFNQSGQYNMQEDPNREVLVGDRYEYNFEINRQYADLFFQSKIKWNNLDWTIGMNAVYTSFFRDGKYQHYRFADNSYGKSDTYEFWNFGIKSNWLYKLNGRNFLSLSGQYSTNAPTADEVFPNARSNNFTVPDLKNAEILSGEFSYILRAPRLKGRMTGFYTLAMHEIEKNFGYIDAGGTGSNDRTYFAAEVLNDVKKEYLGGEFALEAQVTTTISVTGVASVGQYVYKNNPDYYLFTDDASESKGYQTSMDGKTYLENYRIANGPQQGFSLGIEYRDPHYWWVGVNGNYLANNYLDVAPFRRTSDFTYDPGTGIPYVDITEESLTTLLKQPKTSDEFMLNASAGKTFRFGRYYMGISLNVNNVLNNKDYITGGFEQLRGGDYNLVKNEDYRTVFGPRMWYDQGVSYFLNVFLRFN